MSQRNETTRKEFMKTTAGVAAGAALLGTMGFSRPARADGDEAITQIASFGIQEGKEEEARAMLTTMVNAVEEHEPGVLTYICHFSQESPPRVVFFEIYENAGAYAVHGTTDHMKVMFSKFATLFVGPPKIQKLDRVAGLNR